ncbi:right-handed parallel beta-helix repeat-containing protein [Streptomyces sp. NPDC056549]|uniref:right-handed parallel beta-helix repeat-containing protein n=1 Tax=Streptomyces sp. NPDC056549 TaxID=3345864 RepID=UPI003684CFAD
MWSTTAARTAPAAPGSSSPPAPVSGTVTFGALCGDHWGAKGVFHRRIRVIGNTVEKSGAFGIRAADWQDSVIADNTVTGVALHGIYLNSPQGNGLSGITVSGNTVRGIDGSGGRARRHSAHARCADRLRNSVAVDQTDAVILRHE